MGFPLVNGADGCWLAREIPGWLACLNLLSCVEGESDGNERHALDFFAAPARRREAPSAHRLRGGVIEPRRAARGLHPDLAGLALRAHANPQQDAALLVQPAREWRIGGRRVAQVSEVESRGVDGGRRYVLGTG